MDRRMASRMCYLFLILSFWLCVACDQTGQQVAPDEVTVQLKWLHQAQFAGFYVAQAKGYYAGENLKVNFLQGGPGTDITNLLVSDKAQFGVVASELVMIKRQQDHQPITAIAAIYQRSAAVYVSKKGSGITRPEDLAGKTIAAVSTSEAAGEFEYQYSAMMKKLGLDPSKARLVPYDPSYKGFINGRVDVTAAYLTGGVVQFRQKGHDLNLIWPGDYGIHFYSDTLITTDKIAASRPDLVTRFLRATIKGWQDAIGNREDAIETTMKYTRVKDRQLQDDMLKALRPLVFTGEGRIGWMQPRVWEDMHQVLLANGLLSSPIQDFNLVCRMQHLHAIYPKGAP